ncbi:hypothetical protein LQZ19_14395 [Treponema primitia]|uniref:hypothetical protein n=1 Tax=Treponema primitia TaxID=88058 RepID=UPI00397EC0AA
MDKKAFSIVLNAARQTEAYQKLEASAAGATWTSRGKVIPEDSKVIRAIVESGDPQLQRILLVGEILHKGPSEISPEQLNRLISMNSLVQEPIVSVDDISVYLKRFSPAYTWDYIPKELVAKLWKAESERVFGPGVIVKRTSYDFYESLVDYWVGSYDRKVAPIPVEGVSKSEAIYFAALMLLAKPLLAGMPVAVFFQGFDKPLPKLFKFRYLTDVEFKEVEASLDAHIEEDAVHSDELAVLDKVIEAGKEYL